MKNHEKEIRCQKEKCNRIARIEELKIKMGGLICPRCRTILVWSYDPVYIEEFYRRQLTK